MNTESYLLHLKLAVFYVLTFYSVFTSANEVARRYYHHYYDISVCLSGCLLPEYLKKILTYLNQILRNDRPSVKDQSVLKLIHIWAWIKDGFLNFFNVER